MNPLGAILHGIYQRVGSQTLGIFTLLMVALGSVTWGLTRTTQGLDEGQILIIALTGALLGWILGKSRLPSWVSGLVAGMVGLAGFITYFANLGSLLASLPIKLWGLYIGIWRWLFSQGQIQPDREPLVQAFADIYARIANLGDHLFFWIRTLSSGSVASDPLVTMLVWGMLLWLAAGWAAWSIRRRYRVLVGLLPAGIILVSSLNFTHGNALILIPFLGAIFFLSVAVGHQSREISWEKEQIDFSTDIRLDLAIASIFLVAIILLITTLIPSLSIRRILDIGRRIAEKQPVQVENIGESLGLISRPNEEGLFGGITPGGLPRIHLLGSGVELSEQVVMVISTGELSPGPPDNFPPGSIPRHYWRTLTYDQYTGKGWLSANASFVDYKAGDLMQDLDFVTGMPNHSLITQEVNSGRQLGNQIYATGALISADRDFQVAWRPLDPDLTRGADTVETFASQDMYTARFLERPNGQFTYHAQSVVPVIFQDQLRASGVQYPTWIKDRYLALPGTITPRTTRLAVELTAGITNPYDTAVAIEGYLRNFPYSLDIPAPPTDQDVVDYFLFDLQRGYCDYYASAMVVLARLSGLPARMVVGYASGSYNTLKANYVVTEADAHSWVELYFPEVGWVEFEPTGSRPLLEIPEQAPLLKQINPEMIGSLKVGAGSPIDPWRVGVGLLLLTILVFFTARFIKILHRSQKLTPLAVISHLYQVLRNRVESLTRGTTPPIKKGFTPDEFSDGFSNHWRKVSHGPLSRFLLSPASEEADQIVQLYTKAVYSPRPLNLPEQSQAQRTLRRLRWRLLLGRIVRQRMVS